MFGAGCALAYVNYNPQLRDKLKQRSGLIMNNVMQFVLQEKKIFKQMIDEIIRPKK